MGKESQVPGKSTKRKCEQKGLKGLLKLRKLQNL